MKQFFFAIFMFFIVLAANAQATDWYVRSGAGGNGTSWTSAWSNVTNISWSSIAAGDTIWIAGGSYGNLVLGKSGNADTSAGRIFIKRATASAHGAAADWNPAYDAQVNLTGIAWNSLNLGNYVTIDGQVDRGISIPNGGGQGSSVSFNRGVSYVTLRYLDLAGPCGSSACAQGGDNRGIDATAWNGSSDDVVDHLLIQHNKIHGACTQLWLDNTTNGILEYNEIYDSNATDYNNCHPNIIATQLGSNMTFRYNVVHNYNSEGIMMSPNGGVTGSWYIYGNIWYGDAGNSRLVESQYSANGPVYFYNNTVNGIPMGSRTANGGSWNSNSQGANNIYWNAGAQGFPSNSYDFCSGTCSGTGSISSGSNPFVNSAGNDYHIVSTVGAKYPKDKGINLGSPYNTDMDGVTRGADGVWDMGAYEFGTSTVLAKPSAPTLQVN
jgi:hypothetical protein